MNVSAVIPTRGDCDLAAILATLSWCDEVLVWDNSVRPDQGAYGRYAMLAEARNDVVVTQDDDLIVTSWPQILAAYRPGVLTVNYPQPWDIPWLGRGAIFDRDLPGQAFERYLAHHPFDRCFTHHGFCDAVFALLGETNVIDVGGAEDLPLGFAAGRISTEDGWYNDKRPLIQARCAELKAAACI